MPFYRRKVTYDELAPLVQQFRDFLRQNCSLVKEADEYSQEVFLVDKKESNRIRVTFEKSWNALACAGFLEAVPFDYNHIMVYFYEQADGPVQTVTPTHVRLPKLSYLITLCPEDFFALLRLVATAKNTQSQNSLSLNPPAAGLTSLSNSPLEPFFTKLRTNYRFNIDYSDRKWTPRDAIKYLADLDATRDNQLSAMQYLTALQNPDLLYFPIETSIELELDWQQISDDYCVPSNQN